MPKKSKKTEPESPAPAEDESMQDAPSAAVEDEQEQQDEPAQDEEEFEVLDDGKQVRILPGSTPTAASFEFVNEGHTLGNALRYMIMKNPDVEFCAYAIPHPSEPKMNIRIQTYDETSAVDALTKGLKDLQELCDVVTEKFWEAKESVPKTPAPSKKQLDEDGVPFPAAT